MKLKLYDIGIVDTTKAIFIIRYLILGNQSHLKHGIQRIDVEWVWCGKYVWFRFSLTNTEFF